MKSHPVTKKPLITERDGKRTLYYTPLPAPRADGVVAELAGYRKDRKDRWFQ